MIVTRRMSQWGFYALAMLVFVACMGLLRSTAYLQNPATLTWGVTFDLILTIPALYYFCMVRTGRAAAICLLPVFVLCLSLTKLVLPPAGQLLLRPLLLLSWPLEPIGLGIVVFRVHRSMRKRRAEVVLPGDAFERFQQGVRDTYGDNPVLSFLVTELAFTYFGLFGWRLRSSAPEGTMTFTCYKQSGWSAIVGVLTFLIVLEGSIVHLLISHWSQRAAWLWSTLDVYAILWLCGDYQGLRLRPSLLTSDHLVVRLGLRWSGTVPLQHIVSIDRVSASRDVPGGPDYLKVAAMSTPELLITLREPVEFTGLLGRKRMVKRIGVLPDTPNLMPLLMQHVKVI